MGTFASQVFVENANGLAFFGGSIVFEPNNPNYDTGDVSTFSSGQVGSFWISNTNSQVYLSRTAGATTVLGITAI
jgi:hypothetical protein